MKISLLNQKILIQKLDVKTDNIGNQIDNWKDYVSVFTTISGQSPNESIQNGAIWDVGSINFTLRYQKKLEYIDSKNYRIIFRNEIYDIKGIDYLSFKKKVIKINASKIERKNDEGKSDK